MYVIQNPKFRNWHTHASPTGSAILNPDATTRYVNNCQHHKNALTVRLILYSQYFFVVRQTSLAVCCILLGKTLNMTN